MNYLKNTLYGFLITTVLLTSFANTSLARRGSMVGDLIPSPRGSMVGDLIPSPQIPSPKSKLPTQLSRRKSTGGLVSSANTPILSRSNSLGHQLSEFQSYILHPPKTSTTATQSSMKRRRSSSLENTPPSSPTKSVGSPQKLASSDKDRLAQIDRELTALDSKHHKKTNTLNGLLDPIVTLEKKIQEAASILENLPNTRKNRLYRTQLEGYLQGMKQEKSLKVQNWQKELQELSGHFRPQIEALLKEKSELLKSSSSRRSRDPLAVTTDPANTAGLGDALRDTPALFRD